jgi:HD-GYP domain-containing protein (c-di-GMP phosphodiesterase class II)
VGSIACEIYEAWAVKNNLAEKVIEKEKDILKMASMLHDVGKVGISDLILKKPGRFTEEEFNIMQSHTYIGARLFDNQESDLDIIARDIALCHHENWDGSGYPGKIAWQEYDALEEKTGDISDHPVGLKGEEIPLFARIVALADVFDALSSKRVYKDAWSEDDVLNEIKKCRGNKFDPAVVDIFFEILPILRHIQEKYPDSE